MGLFPRDIDAFLSYQGIPRGPNSQVYLVDPANGSDSNLGTKLIKPLASVEAAEDLCVANQHDVVLYIAGATKNDLAATLTWDKSYTHLVGWCAPTNIAQRARIMDAGALILSPAINFTATGGIFKNFYSFQGVDEATSLINVQVTGGRNYFENVHFAGGGHATQAIDGGASLLINGGEENFFKHCTIGIDTIAAGDGMAGVRFDGAGPRTTFEDCLFLMYAGHIGAKFVEIVDSAGFDRFIYFKNCLFLNDSSTITMTEAFTVPAGMGAATHRIVLKDCSFLGVGDIEDNDRGIVFTDSGTYTAGGNSAIMAAVAAT